MDDLISLFLSVHEFFNLYNSRGDCLLQFYIELLDVLVKAFLDGKNVEPSSTVKKRKAIADQSPFTTPVKDKRSTGRRFSAGKDRAVYVWGSESPIFDRLDQFRKQNAKQSGRNFSFDKIYSILGKIVTSKAFSPQSFGSFGNAEVGITVALRLASAARNKSVQFASFQRYLALTYSR